MTFKGFTAEDFDTFQIDGLEARMEAIRSRIQPKFQAIGEQLSSDLSALAGNEMFVHIAKHARRSVNAPKDTWMAFCHNKRGYKQHPHFQIGLFDDHVFVWLAFIYELPDKAAMAKRFLTNWNTFYSTIPDDFVFSFDHMQKQSSSNSLMTEAELKKQVERFRDIKKAELLIGKHIAKEDPLLQNGEAFLDVVRSTFETLMPIYRLAF
ncbi:YktB family protein [Marinicrinis lubricantis]|uniref:UPF0637 protein ACFPXP_13105 n=1 Tax=Marinicrinis lubricantis TaxID=2086470 RepID=A0ABW1IR55_9BACL